MSDKYFGLEGKESKFIINTENISLSSIRLIYKELYISIIILFLIKGPLKRLFPDMTFALSSKHRGFLELNKSPFRNLVFICQGGEHCYGKDSYVYTINKTCEVEVFQVAKSEEANKHLTNFLDRIESVDLTGKSFLAPKYSAVDIGGNFVLVSRNKNVFRYKKNINASKIEKAFLEISDLQSEVLGLDDLLDQYSMILCSLKETDYSVDEILDVIEQLINYLIENVGYKRNVRLSSSHGDFAHWNIMSSNIDPRLLIIDWEWFSLRPLGYDLMHYIVNRNNMSDKRFNGKAAARSVFSCIEKFRYGRDILSSDRYLYSVLYFIEVISYFSRLSFLVEEDNAKNDKSKDYLVIGNYASLAAEYLRKIGW